MNIKRTARVIAAAALMLCPLDAWAQSGGANASAMVFPPSTLPDRGGSLGFAVEPQPYQKYGMYVFKVILLGRNSPVINTLHPGDYIYNVNGYYLNSSDDIFNIIHSGEPGAQVVMSYLSSAEGFSPKVLRATLIPVAEIQAAVAPSEGETREADGASTSRTVRRQPGPGCVPYSQYAVNCQTSDEFRTSHGLPTEEQERANRENEARRSRQSASNSRGKNSAHCVHIEYPSSGHECAYLENKTLGCGVSSRTSAVNSCAYDVDVVFQSGAVITIGANSSYNYYTGDIVLSKTRAH